jgi:hypothetical protein
MISSLQHSYKFIVLRWVMLLLFVSGHTPLVPLAVAGVAALSGDHSVILQQCGKEFRVVLKHPRTADFQQHHHGLLTQVLVSLSAPESSENADHVLVFSGATSRTAVGREQHVQQLGFSTFIHCEGTEILHFANSHFRSYKDSELLLPELGRASEQPWSLAGTTLVMIV